MNAFTGAIADLIVTAVASREDLDDAYECAQAVLAELPEVDREELGPALRRLGDALWTAPPAGAGVVALAAAAIVESGGPPGIVLGPVLDRLEEVLEPAGDFVRACQDTLRRESDPREAVARLGEQIAPHHPDEALAYNAVESLGLAALAMLTREASGRDRARERADLLVRLRAFKAAHERAEQILDVLAVLDREPLIVLYPALARGYLVEVEGVADFAQLHVLLAAELAGSPDAGWIPIVRPDPRLAAAARNQPLDAEAGLFTAVFDLWTTRGLLPDGTLTDDPEQTAHRLNPTDPLALLEPTDGQRVLVLAPATEAARWAPVRRYEAMPGEVRVVRTLTPNEVREFQAPG